MHARLSRERQAGTSRRIEHLRTMRGPDPGQQAATHTAPWPLSPSAYLHRDTAPYSATR
jgi:hypothetical protein